MSDKPHGWLDHGETIVAPPAPRLPEPHTTASATAPRRAMPGDPATFVDWLAHDPAQPDAHWSGPAFLPPPQTGARLLVLADMPDAGADDPVVPFGPAARAFLAALLRAIGLRMDDAAFAPLAVRRPPGGLLDDPTHAALAKRMRHYLGLAAPRAVLILGDRTARALLTAPAEIATGRLSAIDDGGAALTAAALPSVEHLMRRPSAKAASWQTLRLLAGMVSP